MEWTKTIKNAVSNKNIAVISYNSRGFAKEKQEFCQLLTSKQIIGENIPILCNQENFVLRGNSHKIVQTLPNFHCFINPANKDSLDKGRAQNGMFIAVPKLIQNQVTDESPGFWRIQAVTIFNSSSTILLINS